MRTLSSPVQFQGQQPKKRRPRLFHLESVPSEMDSAIGGCLTIFTTVYMMKRDFGVNRRIDLGLREKETRRALQNAPDRDWENNETGASRRDLTTRHRQRRSK